MSPSDSLIKLIHRLHREARTYFEKEMAEHGLVTGSHRVLEELFYQDGMNQQELSDRLSVDKATTTRVIRKLVAAGYVKRHTDPFDKRAYRLFLTPKGRQIAPELSKKRRSWTRILSTGFTREENKTVLDLLKRMNANAASANQRPNRTKR